MNESGEEQPAEASQDVKKEEESEVKEEVKTEPTPEAGSQERPVKEEEAASSEIKKEDAEEDELSRDHSGNGSSPLDAERPQSSQVGKFRNARSRQASTICIRNRLTLWFSRFSTNSAPCLE